MSALSGSNTGRKTPQPELTWTKKVKKPLKILLIQVKMQKKLFIQKILFISSK